jgi:hypothetical protein
VTGGDRAGLVLVPVIMLEHLSPEQLRLYAIADNQIAAQSEFDLDELRIELVELDSLDLNLELTGFSTSEIDSLLVVVNEEPPASADRPETVAVTRPSDLWQLGDYKLICELFVTLLGDEKAAMAFCDAPYNLASSAIWHGAAQAPRLCHGGRSTLSEEADWSVGTVWDLAGNAIHLLHVERVRLEAPDLIRRIEQIHARYQADVTLIEDADLGRGLASHLNRASAVCRPRLVRPTIDKLARMQARAVMFETGKVFMPHSGYGSSNPSVPTAFRDLGVAFGHESVGGPTGPVLAVEPTRCAELAWVLPSRRVRPFCN